MSDPFAPIEWDGPTEPAWPKPWPTEPNGPNVRYLIRTSDEGGRSDGHPPVQNIAANAAGEPLQWPEYGYVQASAARGLGWGLHGLLDGVGNWNYLARFKGATWQIVAVLDEEVRLSIERQCHRAPRGWVVYSGDAVGAMQWLVPYMARNGALADLSQLLCDDAVASDSLLAKTVGERAIIFGEADAAALGSESEVITHGQGRSAITHGGRAKARGHAAIAAALRGGVADADGIAADAIARNLHWSEDCEPAFASAGAFGVAVALGPNTAARTGLGGAIVLSEWGEDWTGTWTLKGVFSSLVDKFNGLHSGRFYRLVDGKPVEVPGPK